MNKLEELKALLEEKQIASKAYKNGGGSFQSHARNQEAHCALIDAALELLPQLIAVAESAKKVPLTFEDIGDGDLFKPNGGGGYVKWDMYDPIKNELHLCGLGWPNFNGLQMYYLRSQDHGKTWERCEKEAMQ